MFLRGFTKRNLVKKRNKDKKNYLSTAYKIHTAIPNQMRKASQNIRNILERLETWGFIDFNRAGYRGINPNPINMVENNNNAPTSMIVNS